MKKFIASVLALVCVGSVAAFTACNSDGDSGSGSGGNIITESHESSEIQLVKNLNTILTIEYTTNGEPQSVEEVIEVLLDEGFDVTKFSPTVNGNILYWDSEANLILIWDEGALEVIYPTTYDSVTSVPDTWYLLIDTE